MEKIVDDQRKIKSIWFEQHGGFEAGKDEITEIKAYWDNGELAPIPWFAVLSGDKVIKRVNAKFIALIEYQN